MKNVICIIFLTHYLTMTTLKLIWRKPSENIVEKGENADKQQFLLPQCFLTCERQTFFSNNNSVVCCLQMLSIWARLNFWLH